MAQTAAPAGAASTAEPTADPRRWIALAVVLSATFMILLDISIVTVAIPSIQTTLHASYADVQLVIAAYAMAYAVTLITGGRLGDIFGRKRLFMIGMAGFVLASAVCGAAQSPLMLITSRVVQGLFAAMMYPQVLSVIQVSFPPRERSGAFGALGAVIGLASITGPLLGGLLTQGDLLGLAWRPIFLINLPIGCGALLAAWLLLHESKAPDARGLDLAGVMLATVALALLTFPLIEGRDQGWPFYYFVMMAASPFALALFVAYERRLVRSGGSPLIALTMFSDRAFVIGLLITVVFFAGIPAFFITVSIVLQTGHGYNALQAGLITVPFAAASAVASASSVRLAPRFGKNIVALGAATIAVGMVFVAVVVRLAGDDLRGWHLTLPFLVCGAGLGMTVAPLINVILAGVNPRFAGAASGVLTTTQQVGAAIGVAVIGVIFFTTIGTHADSVTSDLAPTLQQRLVAAHAPPGQVSAITAGFQRCFHDRANAADPTSIPPSCQGIDKAPPEISTAVSGVAKQALARDFSDSFSWALLLQIVVFGATALLVMVLPRVDLRRGSGAGAAGH